MSEKNPYFGATFAERKAARLGKSQETPPEPVEKAIDAETEQVEDKSVTPEKTARKTAKKS